jgi:hypothetical protein
VNLCRSLWVVSQSEICAAGRLRGSPLWPRSIRGLLVGLAEFELFFVEDMEHSRKCGMIRLNDVTDGSRTVCENRDDEARIFITVSFPHPVPDPEFCGHVPRVAGASARSELCVAAGAPPLRGQAHPGLTLIARPNFNSLMSAAAIRNALQLSKRLPQQTDLSHPRRAFRAHVDQAE